MREIYISDNEANQRLDKFLAKLLNEAPKSFYYKMLRKKNIVLNGKKADGNEKLKQGDCVRLYLSEETLAKFSSAKEVVRPKGSLEILYEDKNVVFLNKPAGLLSQKAQKGDVSVVDYLITYLLDSHAISKEELKLFSPSVCNRLDRNTSGIVAAGKSLTGLQTLSQWFRDRSVGKYYRCLVKGNLSEKQRICGYLRKNHQTNQVSVTDDPTEGSVKIETEYEPIARGKETTLLEVHLITGKTHQIRAHLSQIGHPILGDPKYGDLKLNKTLHLQKQLLHAYRLELPKTTGALSEIAGKTVIAPLPEHFKKVCQEQGVKI